MRKGKEITDAWLADQLRPYEIRPRTIWIGGAQAKGYMEDDFKEVFRRYVPPSEWEALKAEWAAEAGAKKAAAGGGEQIEVNSNQ